MPAALAALTRLTDLSLGFNFIADGPSWSCLPRQLQRLSLLGCGLRRVPAPLAGLTSLTELALNTNCQLEEGWPCLPRQLLKLGLCGCGLRQVPALQNLTRLQELHLGGNALEGGWQQLPPQLLKLGLAMCGLQAVPAELAGLNLQVTGCDPA